MPDITQEGRIIAIDTPLGADVLLLRSFTGVERMSRMFRFHLDMLSRNFNISFDDIVGKNVTITVQLADGSERYLNGHISRFAQLPVEEHLAHYQAEMVPWFWFLTRAADCQIFQEKSVPDIIEKVFGDYGFSDYRLQLQRSYEPRTYCVQYRETAANFLMRLMEEEGIFYYFKHDEGVHEMIIGDDPGAHETCAESDVRYEHTIGEGAGRDESVIYEWRYEQELRPGKYALDDYNFETPSTDLMAKIDSVIDQGGNKKYEVYDYPGEYLKRSRGDSLVRVRMEEEETPHVVVTGSSDCGSFSPGFRFTLSEYDRDDQNQEPVLTAVTHSAHSGSFTGGTEGEGGSYSNKFNCIPYSVPFRPLRTTPKPLVQGCQTAVVVGPKGEEIYVDKYGRVKVQFHWDRLGHKDEKSSCWIRVSQLWAGKNWGAMFIPRIGQEVIVDFLEGDPDRPMITGRVYNAEQTTPYELPSNQTRSCIRSRSSKGGTSSNFNEIRFEDKKGDEQLFLHAEKDMDLWVKNVRREHVGASRHLSVGGDQIEQVGGDKHLTVDGDLVQKIGGDLSLDIGMNRDEKVGLKHALNSGQEIHLKAGMKVIIEAGMQISLVGPGGFVDISPAGVTIQGVMVKINSGGAAGQGSGATTKTPKKPAAADDGSTSGGASGSSGGGGGSSSSSSSASAAAAAESASAAPEAEASAPEAQEQAQAESEQPATKQAAPDGDEGAAADQVLVDSDSPLPAAKQAGPAGGGAEQASESPAAEEQAQPQSSEPAAKQAGPSGGEQQQLQDSGEEDAGPEANTDPSGRIG